jgi:hypothetical protein
MSLFRKHVDAAEPGPLPAPPSQPSPSPQPPAISGSTVDFNAVYTFAQVTAEERDRVTRAEELLTSLPGKASHTRQVVEATLKAFGVDREKIVAAATKELAAVEGYIRSSAEQSQRILDQGQKRITELEAEIERCRQVNAQATREQEERARTANTEMQRLQQVLGFFGQGDAVEEVDPGDPEEPTQVGGSKKARTLAPPGSPPR